MTHPPQNVVRNSINETSVQRPMPFADITNAVSTTVNTREKPTEPRSFINIRSQPRVMMSVSITPPPAITVLSENSSHTPEKNGQTSAYNEDKEMGDVGNSLNADEQIITPEKKLRPRKFLQNFLFLKSLHALPSTPEQKKKHQTSAPFRRPVEDKTVAESSLLSRKGTEGKNLECTHSGCYEVSNTCGLVTVEILPSKKKNNPDTGKDLNENINIGRNGRMMYPEKKMDVTSLTSGSARPSKGIQPSTPKIVSQDVELPRSTEAERADDVADNIIEPNKEKGDEKKDIFKSSASEESGNQTDTVDISGISAINEEDVILQLGDYEPCPPFSTPLDGALAVANARRGGIEFKKGDIEVSKEYELMDFHKIFLEVHLRKMEEIRSSSREGISDSMVSLEEVHSQSLNSCILDLDHFLLNYYDEEINAYKARLLDTAFDLLYTQMVAIPMTQSLEFYGRRILCMQRDMCIRGMIELFVVTIPKVYAKRQRGKKPSYCIRGEKGISLLRNKEVPPRPRTGRSYSASVNGKSNGATSIKHIHNNGGGRGREKPLGQCLTSVRGESGNVAGTSGTRNSLNNQNNRDRLSAYMVVRPVSRKRTPRRSPRDEDLLDIVGLR
ncbi:hypothetical protein LSM04_002908 [Trypanosoma melophagium]|uniref:uncharacterized protein n=1 Tax=Trypanosoma melophagium TaxID=715481 RepID=UPI003519EDCB|nr:hypothetical protein LSM04_002908 [Trypanosoma melophagium]